jgi:putative transposase
MKKRFSEEQIVSILRQAEAGTAAKDICRKHGIAEQTFYHWKTKYGGMSISPAGGALCLAAP